MPGAKVLGGKNGLRVEGHGPIHRGHTDDELVASLEVIGPASLASLRLALRRRQRSSLIIARVALVDVPESKLAREPDNFREDVEITLFEHDKQADYTVFVAAYGDPEDGLPDISRVQSLLHPFLSRHGATVSVRIDDDEYDYGGMYQLGLDISMRVRDQTVRDAYNVATGVLALLDGLEGGQLDREKTVDLLRGGRVDFLLGQPETDRMDFKRMGYGKTEHDKLEFAKDVASFANADGGVLILGVAAVKAGLTETASAITPCAPRSVSAQSYKATLHRRIHPPPERVEIFSVPQGAAGDVWIVSVPPQPEEYKPFLVHGAEIDGKLTDAYFSLVVRRGDDNLPTDPQAVHALLAAGRGVLRMSSSGDR